MQSFHLNNNISGWLNRKRAATESKESEKAKLIKRQLKDFNKDFGVGKVNDQFAIPSTSTAPNLKNAKKAAFSSNPELTTTATQRIDGNEWTYPKRTTKSQTPRDKTGTYTENQYDSLSDMSHDGEDDRDNSRSQSKNKQKNVRAPRPTPIFVKNMQIKELQDFLIENKIPQDSFTLKSTSDNFTLIFTNKVEDHNNIDKLLINHDKRFFGLPLKSEKLKTTVLKGLQGDYDEDSIKQAIEELQIPDITIHKIIKIGAGKYKPNDSHYIIQLEKNSTLQNLIKTRYLLSQRIHWQIQEKNTSSNVPTVKESVMEAVIVI